MSAFRPLSGVEQDSSGGWRWSGGDPQVELLNPDGGAWVPGWYVLDVNADVADGVLLGPQLFLDFGDGYSDAARIDVEEPDAATCVRQIVLIPEVAHSVRFDPSVVPATLSRFEISLRRISRITAFAEMAKRLVACEGRRALISHVVDWSRVFLGQGLGGIGSSLRSQYQSHLRIEKIDYATWARARKTSCGDVRGPKISVLMPTWNTPLEFLEDAVRSVREQSYVDWELCIADDASTMPALAERLSALAAADSRIKVVKKATQGGIAEATNSALALATGEYVAFLDHDDVLAPNALGQVAAALRASGADVAYTDHDYLSREGYRCSPYFKPSWSPDLLLSQMYLGHLVVARRSAVIEVGGARSGFDGSQDYDLVLRLVRAGGTVTHVPEVLYHWRQHAGSTAGNPGSKPYAHNAGKHAIEEHLANVAAGATVSDGPWLFCYDVRYPVPTPAPLASIIIPTRDRLDLLEPCVRTLLEQTRYPSFELIVVDNGSVEASTQAWLSEMSAREPRFRTLRIDESFNWSRLNNAGVAEARGDILVFLNNDTETIDPDWLGRMVENALRPEVGAVGPLLLYPDGSIQHAGVVVGLGGWADHPFKGMPTEHRQEYFASPMLRRNVLAVTGACMVVERSKFVSLGGFDETFIVCGSDVELCLRAHSKGLWNVYLPEARMVHHESKTRDASKVPENDFRRSSEAYGAFRHSGDPFFNPNLDWSSTTPSLGGLVR